MWVSQCCFLMQFTNLCTVFSSLGDEVPDADWKVFDEACKVPCPQICSSSFALICGSVFCISMLCVFSFSQLLLSKGGACASRHPLALLSASPHCASHSPAPGSSRLPFSPGPHLFAPLIQPLRFWLVAHPRSSPPMISSPKTRGSYPPTVFFKI